MLIDMKCPSCGASMQYDDSREFMFCPYCSAKVSRGSVFSQPQSDGPNLFISFNSNNSAVGMVTRIVSTGTKNTYINGQTLSFHLPQGPQTIILKIGKKNYSRNIIIPPDNSPVRIYASFNGRAQITIDQPHVPTINVEVPKTNQAPRVQPNSTQTYNASTYTNKTSSPQARSSEPINKTTLIVLLVCAGVFTLFLLTGVGLASRNRGSSATVTKCSLYLDIASENNLFFSTYDITISLDGEQIGSVADGKEFTYLTDVSRGMHTLTFCKSGSTSPRKTKSITVSNDMTYYCKLSHSSTSISIKDENIEDNIVGSALEVLDVTGIPLDEAMNALENAGFTNFREEPYGSIWEKGNWIVASQSVSAGSVVDKNEYIQLNCVRGDEYFDNDFVGKNIIECQKQADGAWYTLYFRDRSMSKLDVSSMDDETKANWVATSVSYGRAYKEVYITVDNSSQSVSTSEATTTTSSTAENTSGKTKPARYHSSNNREIAQSGDSGVYSYKNLGGNYDVYWIIDFDEGYVYYFTDGNGEESCMRVEIVEGTLNTYVLITYHEEDLTWDEAICFKWQGQPDILVWQDSDGFATEFYPTDIDKALEVRDTKTIIDY